LNPGKNHPLRARFGFALQGIAHALSTEASLRTQAALGAVALIALVVLRPAAVWWALVLLAGSGVLAAELLNTAIEQLADEMGAERTEGIRIVKDCAAGAVLIAAAGAVAVGTALALHLLNK
jgi:undecaprenol kinase